VVADVPGASGALEGDEGAPAEAAGATTDLPLFRATLSAGQVKEVKAIAGELIDLRDRLRKALEAGKRARS
jgi:hypothetical protein